MHIESIVSGHWTDDQLIARLYGAEGTDSGGAETHLSACVACRSRLRAMETRRSEVVSDFGDWSDVSPAFLAEQRRRIYERLSAAQSWWNVPSLWRWASAGTAVAALGAGLVMFTESRPAMRPECKVSDAQLAQEVSSLSLDAEAKSAAPLKALFEY